jgi:hypothetical protein
MAGFDIPSNVLESLPKVVLFYPCSGTDFAVPLFAFAANVTSFWFVDKQYTDDCLVKKITELCPGLVPLLEWQDQCIWEPAPTTKENWPDDEQLRYPWIEPIVYTERYLHCPSNELITIHRRRGYGVACLRKREFESIAVFFYRGDTPAKGEGSSGTLWLRENGMNLFGEVVTRMTSGSLIVTDGSNCSGASLKALRQVHSAPHDATLQLERTDFQTIAGRHFKYVGHVDPRYGPTLVWRMQ